MIKEIRNRNKPFLNTEALITDLIWVREKKKLRVN